MSRLSGGACSLFAGPERNFRTESEAAEVAAAASGGNGKVDHVEENAAVTEIRAKAAFAGSRSKPASEAWGLGLGATL